MRALLLIGILAAAVSSSAAAQAPDGKEVYDRLCKKCHGATGVPSKAMKTKFEKIAAFDAAFVAKRPVDEMVKVLVKGKGEGMKSFSEKMKPDEMTAVAKYVHELAKP